MLAGATACEPAPIADGERRTALRGTTERVILPTYRELVSSTSTLADELSALESSGEAADAAEALAQVGLAPARQAYLDARGPFEESLAFAFGPAIDLHSLANIDAMPIDAEKLDALLAGDGKLDVKAVRVLGSNKRGLHGIEYLLFPEGDEALEAALLADDEAGRRRRQYLSSAARVVADAAQALSLAWLPEGGDFARRFSEPGGPDSVSDTVQASLDTLLNECVYLSEVVANSKLG
ncbi:MAG TPA: imelysin family protein, partial [Polyangiaceae bacterium]